MRKITAVVTLFGVLGAGLGIPITMPARPSRDEQADFACAGHGCGCQTAEMCRTHCCCNPPSKLRLSQGTEHELNAKSEHDKNMPAKRAARFAFQPLNCKGIPSAWLGVPLYTMPIPLVLDLPPAAFEHCIAVQSETFVSLQDSKPPTPPPRA